MRLTLRLGSGLKLTGAFVPRLNNLYLTANNVSEAVTGGSTVGTLTFGQTSGSTFTLIDNASGQFALSGLNINTARTMIAIKNSIMAFPFCAGQNKTPAGGPGLRAINLSDAASVAPSVGANQNN